MIIRKNLKEKFLRKFLEGFLHKKIVILIPNKAGLEFMHLEQLNVPIDELEESAVVEMRYLNREAERIGETRQKLADSIKNNIYFYSLLFWKKTEKRGACHRLYKT